MHTINATTARKEIFNLIDEVNDSADAITITKGESEAVLMGADEYRSIMETLHIFSTPANRAHIEASLAAFDRGDFVKSERFAK